MTLNKMKAPGLVFLLVGVVCGQDVVLQEWEASQLPDPYTNPQACGRYEKKPAYVCDPNSILPAKGADALDWFLEGVYMNDTVCPCSDYKCEFSDAKPFGTIINIAVVRKIKMPAGQERSEENLLNAARQFTFNLEQTYWNKGVCDNDVVIVYSAEDETLFTLAGRTSALKLNDELITEITNHHMRHFVGGKDLTAGLYSLVVDYRNVFRGEYRSWREYDKSQQPIGGTSHPVASIATFLSLVMAFILTFSF